MRSQVKVTPTVGLRAVLELGCVGDVNSLFRVGQVLEITESVVAALT